MTFLFCFRSQLTHTCLTIFLLTWKWFYCCCCWTLKISENKHKIAKLKRMSQWAKYHKLYSAYNKSKHLAFALFHKHLVMGTSHTIQYKISLNWTSEEFHLSLAPGILYRYDLLHSQIEISAWVLSFSFLKFNFFHLSFD